VHTHRTRRASNTPKPHHHHHHHHRCPTVQVLEHRKVTGDLVRGASESAFDRRYAGGLTRETARLANTPAKLAAARSSAGVVVNTVTPGDSYVSTVEERYRPQRKFRRHASLWRSDAGQEVRVQSCLLEYGERTAIRVTDDGAPGGGDEAGSGGGGKGRGGTDFDRKFAQLHRAAKAEEEERRKAAMERERSMLDSMSEAKAGVSGSNVVSIVNLGSEEMRRAAAEYAAKEEELRALAESGDLLAVRLPAPATLDDPISPPFPLFPYSPPRRTPRWAGRRRTSARWPRCRSASMRRRGHARNVRQRWSP